MNRPLAAFLLIATPATSSAHEVWIERDGTGPARIYLGEPAEPLPPGGDPEFAKLKAPKLLPERTAQPVRKAGFLEVAVGPGDVRATDDSVFAPWGAAGKQEGVTYFARAGRDEARAAMPFEIAPVAPGADAFLVTRLGKPATAMEVTVISPDKWTRRLRTDAEGRVTVPLREKGRYLLTAAARDEGSFAVDGKPVAVLHQITTTSFVVD